MKTTRTLVMLMLCGLSAASASAQSWTAPRTFVAGELVTAAMLNTHVRDNLTVLRAGGFAVTSQAIGDILCASSTTQFARLAASTAGQVMIGGGAGTCPAYNANVTATAAGLLTVSGFGTHSFVGAGTGQQDFVVENTTSGAANSSRIIIGSDGILQYFTAGYTPANQQFASGLLLQGGAAGGLTLAASHASGDIRIYTGGTTKRAEWSQGGLFMTGGGAPTLSACGTGPSITGTDNAGEVVVGTGSPTACTMTFSETWTNAPTCVAMAGNDSNIWTAADEDQTTVSFGFPGTINAFRYVCIGKP